jgi:hypothetical protein
MRGLGLTLLSCCAFACATPPSTDADADADASESEVEVEQPSAPEPRREAEVVEEGADPLLAQARSRVRSGRVPEALRRELVASDKPDHRHAARLLQAIAGEPPASVLARTGGGAAEIASAEELFEPEEELEPDAELVDPLAEADAEAEPEAEDDAPERPPKLASFPIGSPAWEWFASGLTVVELPKELVVPEPRIEIDAIVGPLPLLLRERPPLPELYDDQADEGPRLVILTSLALRPGSSSDVTTLELAGAGEVKLDAQPLTSGRLRLTAIDAGAVPSFLAARPSAPGLEVVEVARRGRRLEIEVELGPGWYLRAVTSLENGASVQFGRLE